jgi:hypothetical protein
MVATSMALRKTRPRTSLAGALLWVALTATLTVAAACGGSDTRVTGSQESQPTLSLEAPVAGELLLPFQVAGWAIDRGATSGPGVERVEVLDGGCGGRLLGEAELGIERPDVAAQYGERFTDSGWQFLVDELSVGRHELGVRLITELSATPVCQTVVVSIV